MAWQAALQHTQAGAAVLTLQDYYNLVDVYLDAVLQPRCVTDPQTFAQEGWHYELDDAKVGLRLFTLLVKTESS